MGTALVALSWRENGEGSRPITTFYRSTNTTPTKSAVRSGATRRVRSGSFTSVSRYPRHFRLSPKSGGTADIAGCLEGAKTRLMHCNKRRTWVSFDHLVGAQQK